MYEQFVCNENEITDRPGRGLPAGAAHRGRADVAPESAPPSALRRALPALYDLGLENNPANEAAQQAVV